MKDWLPLVIIAVAVLLAGALGVIWLSRKAKRQEVIMERMRTSETFRQVKKLLDKCRRLHIERVDITSEGVKVTLYHPPGATLQCDFESCGIDPVRPEPLSALARLVGTEVPELSDSRRYFFKVKKNEKGAQAPYRYTYHIQAEYKDKVLRASYDRQG